jgi:hypothetical protein
MGPNSFDPAFFAKITIIAWHAVCVLGCTVMYAACNRSDNNIWKFIHKWQALCSSPQSAKCVKKLTTKYAVIGWFLVAINSLFSFYAIWQSELYDLLLMPAQLFMPTNELFWFKIFSSFVMFYLMSAWIFPLIFSYIICCVLYYNFRFLCEEMAQDSKDNNNTITHQSIASYRRRHNEICRLLDTADDILHFYIGGTIGAKTVLLCVMLYNIIWYRELLVDPLVTAMNVFWLLSGFVVMCVIAIGGALVNHVVSSLTHLFSDRTYVRLTLNMSF